MILREAVAAGAQRLAANPHLQANAARDAELLLLSDLHISRASLLAHPDRELTQPEQEHYEASLARRFTNEPIQYILGRQEFYGLTFRVTPAVLIPRPETEHLVEAVLQRFSKAQPLRLLDVGTGSGAIAIALATHLPQAQVTAVDLSPTALAVAQANAQTHGLAQRIRFLPSDLLRAVSGERFEVIVSNPPYIPTTDRASLHPEVRDYEPQQALFAGTIGLDVYQRLIPQAYEACVPGGMLALEIGFGQRDAVADLLADWRDVTFLDDLRGIPRVAIATRPA